MATTDDPLDNQVDIFRRAGDHAVSLVAQVPPDGWGKPALGTWTVRMLVGHISRSFVTVIEYSARPADERQILSAADYYRATASFTDAEAIRVRAEQAALALGDRPLDTIRELRDRAVTVLVSVGDPLIHTIAGGMRLSDYLPTRIFELAVHSADLAQAIGQPDTLPADVAQSSLDLAVGIAGLRGDAAAVLLALTGRAPLPPGYSVV
jgi:uncharacterized protein (TIGR03083 family)